MITLNHPDRQVVTNAYVELSEKVYRYISKSINRAEDARDLTHDVFVRVMEYSHMLSADTIRPFIFVTARNIVNDYLRHYYCVSRVHSEILVNADAVTDCTAQQVETADICRLEKEFVRRLPRQRQAIYRMSRYAEMSVGDISQQLSLSTRTVENHLRLGRRDVREYVRRHIS